MAGHSLQIVLARAMSCNSSEKKTCVSEPSPSRQRASSHQSSITFSPLTWASIGSSLSSWPRLVPRPLASCGLSFRFRWCWKTVGCLLGTRPPRCKKAAGGTGGLRSDPLRRACAYCEDSSSHRARRWSANTVVSTTCFALVPYHGDRPHMATPMPERDAAAMAPVRFLAIVCVLHRGSWSLWIVGIFRRPSDHGRRRRVNAISEKFRESLCDQGNGTLVTSDTVPCR